MSWLDQVSNNVLTVTCGDGEVYRPLWVGASFDAEWNTSEFEFPENDGTFISKRRPKGRRYNIEFYFSGEDHLETMQAFLQSANDERPWNVAHPLYGTLVVHPLKLSIDNSVMNISKITGQIVETITNDNPKTVIDPVDQISVETETTYQSVVDSSASVRPTESDVAEMDGLLDGWYTGAKSKISDPTNSELYFNLFNKANTKIALAQSDLSAAITDIQNFINAPALFADSVQARVNLLSSQLDLLRSSLANVTTVSSKGIYFFLGSSILSAMCRASSIKSDTDYQTRTEVFNTIELISNQYDTFIDELNGLKTKNNAKTNSFMPTAKPLFNLNQLVSFTISQLFVIALESKQERSIMLEDDSNIILLCHRVYGLDDNDSNMKLLIAQNNIGPNELYILRKGRRINYYV